MKRNVSDYKITQDVLNELRDKKHLINIIENKAQLKKEYRQNENKKRQERCANLWEEYNNRIDRFQKQTIINNNIRVEVNRQNHERAKQGVSIAQTLEKRKNNDLKKIIKDREIKTQNLLAEKKAIKLHQKQNKDVKCYYKKVQQQTDKVLVANICEFKLEDSIQESGSYEDEIEEEYNTYEENHCSLYSDQSKFEEICNRGNLGDFQIYLERISALSKKFETCEEGRCFLVKTAPIWESLTQCFYRKSSILKYMANPSENVMPEEYRKVFHEKTSNENLNYRHTVRTSFLKTIITDLDYEISDNDVLNALVQAKHLADETATALEIMDLVKVILEYEIDAKDNVQYIVSGLYRRSVFEYTKRRISYRMLGRSKNTIARLQYLNEINLIPKQLLMTKNTEMLVEPIVLDFLKNDEKYKHLTAEKDIIKENNMYPNESQMKMQIFMRPSNPHDAGDLSNENIKNSEVLINYQLLGRIHLEKHVDTQIDRLMTFVYKQLASCLSKKPKKSTSYRKQMDEGELTRATFNVLARKIAKMVYGMGGCYEEKLYVMEKIMKHMVDVVAKRSPKVLYKNRSKNNNMATEAPVNINYYMEQLKSLRASNS